MVGDILLRLVSVLAIDDVRLLKASGCEADIRACLTAFDRMAIQWRKQDFGHVDSQVWADVQIKLNELNAALRG